MWLTKFSKGNAFLFGLFVFAIFSLACMSTGIAQDTASSTLNGQVTDLLGMYAQHKGSALGITFLVLQVLLKVFKTSFLDKLVGKWKLVIVAALSLGGAVVANLVQGGNLGSIIGDAAVLTAAQVFFNQVLKQFSKKA